MIENAVFFQFPFPGVIENAVFFQFLFFSVNKVLYFSSSLSLSQFPSSCLPSSLPVPFADSLCFFQGKCVAVFFFKKENVFDFSLRKLHVGGPSRHGQLKWVLSSTIMAISCDDLFFENDRVSSMQNMQRNGRNKAIEGYMAGLIIHFRGTVTGFAFQSWGDFFA